MACNVLEYLQSLLDSSNPNSSFFSILKPNCNSRRNGIHMFLSTQHTQSGFSKKTSSPKQLSGSHCIPLPPTDCSLSPLQTIALFNTCLADSRELRQLFRLVISQSEMIKIQIPILHLFPHQWSDSAENKTLACTELHQIQTPALLIMVP